MSDFAPVAEQLDILRRGSVDLISEPALADKLERSRTTGKPLVVKVGFDPSAPDIHLGHTVVLRKMKQFQDLGHEIVFVVGDFTGMIGDPSGKSKTRRQLTREEVLENAETYRQQAFKILDPDSTRLEFNSTWLDKLGAAGFIKLAGKYTVARMLERDDFEKRFKAHQPISMHEFLYPLAQAYDSVALHADVEMGGTDQLFNLLVGRDIMREYGLEPQVVLTLPLLVGTDGVEKMSKSLDNYIAVEDAPKDMFGKVMSISDHLMFANRRTDSANILATNPMISTGTRRGARRMGPGQKCARYCNPPNRKPLTTIISMVITDNVAVTKIFPVAAPPTCVPNNALIAGIGRSPSKLMVKIKKKTLQMYLMKRSV